MLNKIDSIDFDYFTSSMDITLDNEAERQLFLNRIEPGLNTDDKQNRTKIISRWIKIKREDNEKLSPGQMVHSGLKLVFFFFLISGFLTGLGTAFSYLSYSGTRPVNIAVFLFVFVFSQIFFQIMSLVTVIGSRVNLFSNFFSSPYSLVLKLIKKVSGTATGNLSSEKRLQVEASIGRMKIGREKFGNVYFWTVFKLFQATGLMFGTGVLTATFFKVVTSDLAFGWQTTIQTAPEKIFDLVKGFALPWSWLVPAELAYPDLANISGSQILLKDGIVELASADMAAWWPFLCFAVLFYTMIPRLFLITVGVVCEKTELRKLFCHNAAVDRLLLLLTSPQMLVETNRRNVNDQAPAKTVSSPKESGLSIEAAGVLIALIPEDIDSSGFDQYLRQKTEKKLGFISETITITGDSDEDSDIFFKLKEKTASLRSCSILIIFESWLPPIKEATEYIKTIRDHLGKTIHIIVLLIGKPDIENSGFSAVKESDYKIWHWKIKAIGDPDISILRDNN